MDLAEQFEQHRAHLERVAYRMLGSHTEAEDAVQEGWLRLSRSDDTGIDNLGAWLTTVVARVCLDLLRARREHVGLDDVPEVIAFEEGPEDQALLADSVGVALVVVLERLTPQERIAFVLHDMFAISFAEIAHVLETTPSAARQLASRGRRRVRGASAPAQPDAAEQRRLVDAFLAASRGGNLDALVGLLAPDVVFRVRGAGAPDEARGADVVARRVLERGARFAHLGRHALVNGTPGVLVGPLERPLSVVAFTVSDGRIASLDVFVRPTIAV